MTPYWKAKTSVKVVRLIVRVLSCLTSRFFIFFCRGPPWSRGGGRARGFDGWGGAEAFTTTGASSSDGSLHGVSAPRERADGLAGARIDGLTDGHGSAFGLRGGGWGGG